MVRIVGVDLPENKRVEIALTYIYGIGRALSQKILAQANISPNKKVKNLLEQEVVALREALKDYKLEGDLRRDIALNIKRLIDIGAYRGSRHRRGLPCRGQRTRTNARTKRGARRTIGVAKRKEERKIGE